MFPLHDRTRRRIALTAFGAIGVLPTLLVLLWGLSRQTPWHAQAQIRRLESALGLRIGVQRVCNPEPGVWRYDGFSLYDPETGSRLLHCEQLEVRDSGRGRSTPATLLLHAQKPVADERGAIALYGVLTRAMQGQMGPAGLDLAWSAEEAALGEGEHAVRFRAVAGGTRSRPGGVQARIHFRLAGGAGAEPASIEVYRNRLTSPPGLELRLATGNAPLPCRLLAAGLPALRALGHESEFRGFVRAEGTPHGWHGEVTGHFSNVDLGRLVGEQFAQPLVGVGEVAVQHARFDGSRVEEAWGSVVVGPGAIGRRLLDAAVMHLRLVQNAPPEERDGWVPYRKFAANWRIDADGLRIEGGCTSAGPGTLLAGMGPWQVAEPVVQPLPVGALVRTLVPDGVAEVPATYQAAWLLRHLPLPEAAPDTAHRRSAERLR